MYTQCPACQTLFRISEKQLSAARGKVRCGKCNHVYNAQGTLLDELPGKTSTAATAPAKPAINPSNTAILENDEVMKIIAEETGSNTSDITAVDIDLSADAPASMPIAKDKLDSFPPAGIEDDDWEMVDLGQLPEQKQSDDDQFILDEDDDDDDWFDEDDDDQTMDNLAAPDLDDDDDWDDDSSVSETGFDENDDDWLDKDSDEMDDEDVEDFMRHVSDYLDDDAAEELISGEKAADIINEVQQQLSFEIDEDLIEKKSPSSGVNLPGSWLDDMDKPTKASSTSIPLGKDEEQELNDAILKSMDQTLTRIPVGESKPAGKPSGKENIILQSSGQLIGQHDKLKAKKTDDKVPLRLRESMRATPGAPRSITSWILLSVLMAVLIVALAAQVVLFRSTELAARYPQLQPWLIDTCQKFPCRDASRHDIDQIQLMSRNISQHPKVKSALLIQAAIINRAPFAQRYPNIQITLSDLTGNTVAQRVFKPQEYLGSLYHPFLQMKPGEPVHLALEVLDPGNTAINFEFNFL